MKSDYFDKNLVINYEMIQISWILFHEKTFSMLDIVNYNDILMYIHKNTQKQTQKYISEFLIIFCLI